MAAWEDRGPLILAFGGIIFGRRNNTSVVIPLPKELKKVTLHAIIKKAGISVEELKTLL